MSAEINFLKKQIDVKDTQLSEKDKQIEQLSESLRASQMLQAGLVQQVQCLSSPDKQTEPEPEPEAKPRWNIFKRWKKWVGGYFWTRLSVAIFRPLCALQQTHTCNYFSAPCLIRVYTMLYTAKSAPLQGARIWFNENIPLCISRLAELFLGAVRLFTVALSAGCSNSGHILLIQGGDAFYTPFVFVSILLCFWRFVYIEFLRLQSTERG